MLLSLQDKLIFHNCQKTFPQRNFCLVDNACLDEKSKPTKPFSLKLDKHVPKDVQGERSLLTFSPCAFALKCT